jgi:DNA invertase Pin-like site-specific DNA recombinase
MIYGYARVSTAAQDETGQVRQLEADRMRKDVPRENHRRHGRPAAA